MLPEHRVLDDPCPVTDQMLGEMYRASAHGLNELIATVPPTARALLAVFCYRRAHLASIGLAIAATCEEDDLTSLGGNAGAMLFERSAQGPTVTPFPLMAAPVTAGKSLMAVGPLRSQSQTQNREDLAIVVIQQRKSAFMVQDRRGDAAF